MKQKSFVHIQCIRICSYNLRLPIVWNMDGLKSVLLLLKSTVHKLHFARQSLNFERGYPTIAILSTIQWIRHPEASALYVLDPILGWPTLFIEHKIRTNNRRAPLSHDYEIFLKIQANCVRSEAENIRGFQCTDKALSYRNCHCVRVRSVPKQRYIDSLIWKQLSSLSVSGPFDSSWIWALSMCSRPCPFLSISRIPVARAQHHHYPLSFL